LDSISVVTPALHALGLLFVVAGEGGIGAVGRDGRVGVGWHAAAPEVRSTGCVGR
jgi:hypothetical protein